MYVIYCALQQSLSPNTAVVELHVDALDHLNSAPFQVVPSDMYYHSGLLFVMFNLPRRRIWNATILINDSGYQIPELSKESLQCSTTCMYMYYKMCTCT